MTEVDADATPTAPDVSPQSHFARIGGTPAVKSAVDLFYDRVLADRDLVDYFDNTDMAQQRRHMVLMLTAVLGGPNDYTGRSLTEAHQPLHIPVAHYARVGQHLVATLTELGVPADVLADVQVVLAQVQDQIVTTGR